MNYRYFILILLALTIGCKSKKLEPIKLNATFSLQKNIPLKKEEQSNWYFKDILIDSIPGISLQRAYDSILSYLKPIDSVIVAIIDTEIDCNHEDLKDNFWVNKKEIPNNKIDDDKNGYVDDVYGWNFIGNLNGDNIIYSSLECVRIIQRYQKEFEGKIKEQIAKKDIQEFERYLKAKKYYEAQLKIAKSVQKHGDFLFNGYPKAKKAMKKIFPKEDYTTKKLDSVYKKYKKKNPTLAKNAYFISDCIKYKLSEEWILNYKKEADTEINTLYNLNYFDRNKIDKNPNDINFKNYGNPYLSNHIDNLYHGTLMAGIIAAKRNNDVGINGITNSVKIMPIAISSNGDEHDKDIALAIRYAVNNGAKVINMSFGKVFSLHKDWVIQAMKYAEKKNVLIISSAGNLSKNLNIFHDNYPNDNIDNQEQVDNFMLVGSTSSKIDKTFLSYYSNYGNKDVDVFAPGQNIESTMPNNTYRFDSGTSISSAVTSGVAALIYSYYPNLTASQVKHILMDSGIKYNVDVAIKIGKTKKMIPFSSLSKSGKVINAYNALLMADSISKK